jgi:proline iminopeptidase
MSRDSFIAFRRSLGRTPPLDRMTVRVRGLDFAVWTSPPVDGALPLLLVNGGMLHDHNLLWPALSPLAGSRQLVLYDQRGRGASQAPADRLAARIEDDAEDVGALRRALGIRRWDVLGHSWGGGIAMLAVSRDQAATRRLVTVDAVGPTSAWMHAVHLTALERVDAADRATLEQLGGAPLHDPDPVTHSTHARAMYRAWFADPDLASYLAAPTAASATGAASLARLRRDGYDWTVMLRALSVPTLVIHGERDALPVSVALELSALLPRARHVLIPAAGHMPFWEAPVRFFGLVDEFLGALPPPPRPDA